jgi:glutamyl-tRNA reductase
MKSIERKIPDLTVREKKVLNKHTKSIINQLLKEPVTQAKELADSKDADESLALFVNIFGIEEEVKEELAKQVVKKKNNNEKNNEKEVSFPNISPLTTF